MLPDAAILTRIGSRLKEIRLKQNITQRSLATSSSASLSSIGKMNARPSQFYEIVQSAAATIRKRASGHLNHTQHETTEW